MNMKKYISIIALSGLVLSSCSDFLDVQSEGNPTTNAYFTNDQQAIDAIDGLYAPIHQETGFGRELFWEQGAACDIVWGRTRGYNTLATFAYTGDESPISDTFNMFYQNMSRSNWIIKQLLNKKKTTQLTDVETRSLGEAYFMRGMAHFWIAYRYGTMDQAISYLPKFEEYSDDDKGRAHQAAAVAYKAKVYAYWATWDEGKWNDVIAMVNELENTYGRDLAPTFAEIFSSDFADFWNAEYIWSIPSTGGSTGGGVEFPGIVLENKGWGIYNGWGQLKPSYDIYEEMAKDGAGNDRLVRSILEYNQEFEFFGEKRRFFSASDLEAGFQINKYMDPFKHKDATNEGYVNTNGDWPTARINFPLIR